MFTTFDKAIAAFLTAIVSMLSLAHLANLSWLTPDMITGISGVLAGLVTYAVPNRPAA